MIVGLTGGIGSGKTTVARIFALLGCAVFDSDRAAKDAYVHDHVREKVRQLLGADSYLASGKPNRGFIAKSVFGDAAMLGRLNAIIHPEVGTMFREFVNAHGNQMVIKESALLFEAGIAGQCAKVITVTAPDELRIERVMKRDRVSADDVRARMARQMQQEEKLQKSDFVVVNDNRQLVIPQVIEINRMLKG
jgi:dephospho-CoA kinase